jgi:ubiquinone/menaquinone biosynthesis C-methylase UbiE
VKERFYDRLNGSLDRKGLAERRERLVGSLTGDVLEVGAGTGLNVPRYRCARRIVAVEPDHQYLRRLRARAADAAIPVEVIQASAETLPLPDDSFDHVVTCISLCSVTDIDAALTQIHRVLRPRGSLMFLEHIRDSGRLGHWQHRLTPLQRRIADNCHLDRDTPAAIQNAGFRIQAIEHFTMPPAHPLIKQAVQGNAVKQSKLAHPNDEQRSA